MDRGPVSAWTVEGELYTRQGAARTAGIGQVSQESHRRSGTGIESAAKDAGRGEH